jgi:hypothetical protein
VSCLSGTPIRVCGAERVTASPITVQSADRGWGAASGKSVQVHLISGCRARRASATARGVKVTARSRRFLLGPSVQCFKVHIHISEPRTGGRDRPAPGHHKCLGSTFSCEDPDFHYYCISHYSRNPPVIGAFRKRGLVV